MKNLYTLTLILGLLPPLAGQEACTIEGTGILTSIQIVNCLATNSCNTGTSNCEVIITGDRTINELIDLTGYPNLTVTIQGGADGNGDLDGSGGSLTFNNNGSNDGELKLASDATLLIEDTDDIDDNSNAYRNGGGADNLAALHVGTVSGGSSQMAKILIRIGSEPYTKNQFTEMISAGGATQSGVLPIELVSFEAKAKIGVVHLSWRTAIELNNDYMAVEYSSDGRRYDEVGRVLGAGTTQVPQNYSFEHNEPAAGQNYYRLRQVDYDGQYAYHGPVTARLDGAGSTLQVYPAVTADELVVTYTGRLDADAVLSVQTLDGRQLRQWAWDSKSSRRTTLDVADLPSGIYVLRLQNGRELTGKRFIKQ